LLRLVDAWQAAGQDVTGEAYPWTAGMTDIQSAIFADGFQQRLGISYSDLQWGSTGQRLTEESFRHYRTLGGLVIVHNNTPAAVSLAINHSKLMIASDGLKGHPRNAGTYARVLGRYVRESDGLELMPALKKMCLLPAQRLEGCVKSMRRKGRIQVGCDADLTLFDPETISEQATYEEPSLPSQGIEWVLVNGTPIVRRGELVEDARPGRAIRAVKLASGAIPSP
jgi:dihydroorotase